MKEDWTKQIKELSEYFNTAKLPGTPFKFNEYMTIYDMSKFITAHMDTLKRFNGIRTYKPCLKRLYALKKAISDKGGQLLLF
jgi:hypothetical protein